MNLSRLHLLSSLLVISFSIHAQKNSFGFILQGESASGKLNNISPGATKKANPVLTLAPGISFETRISKRSGLEIELKYRHAFNHITVVVANGSNFNTLLHFTTQEKFLSLPVLYKLYQKRLAFAIGPTVEYLVKGEQTEGSNIHLSDEFYPERFSWGLLGKLSGTIMKGHGFRLEPGLFCNPVLSFNRTYYGISLAAKF